MPSSPCSETTSKSDAGRAIAPSAQPQHPNRTLREEGAPPLPHRQPGNQWRLVLPTVKKEEPQSSPCFYYYLKGVDASLSKNKAKTEASHQEWHDAAHIVALTNSHVAPGWVHADPALLEAWTIRQFKTTIELAACRWLSDHLLKVGLAESEHVAFIQPPTPPKRSGTRWWTMG